MAVPGIFRLDLDAVIIKVGLLRELSMNVDFFFHYILLVSNVLIYR